MIETGIYVRIRRDDGRWDAVDVGEMTEGEIERWTNDFDRVEGQKWTRGLVSWIQRHVVTQPNRPAGHLGTSPSVVDDDPPAVAQTGSAEPT